MWDIASPIIIDAWKYSNEKGILPPSHRESVITLLPKEGKDISDIKNWRPITLSNCDAKIITKALAMKMNNVIGDIIFIVTLILDNKQCHRNSLLRFFSH